MLKFGTRFTLKTPTELESYQSFYTTQGPAGHPYRSPNFLVIGVMEKGYIIAKNLNTTFRPEYDTIKDESFILKLIECEKIILSDNQ